MEPDFDIHSVLFEKYGPIIGGNDLVKILGYKTPGAFNKSIRQSRIGLLIFDIPGRKGKFAYTSDFANWVNQLIKKD